MPTLDWIGKKKVVNHHQDVPFKVLNKSYTFSAAGKAAESENKIIHGDNLEALKALLPEYEGRIKCIYIDPPYNTGNEGWVYNDNVNDPKIKKWLGEVVGQEGEDLTRHDKWLCMMYPRLKLLQRLLSDDGAIFISIDDNEQANLKLICDEIFGIENGLGPFIQLKGNSKNDTNNIQKNHEYVFTYRKNARYFENGKLEATIIRKNSKEKEVFKENDEFYYLNDSITTRGEGGTLNARPNLGYTVYFNEEKGNFLVEADYDVELAKNSNDVTKIYKTDEELVKKGYFPIRPPLVRGQLGAWTWELDKFKRDSKFIKITGKKGKYAVHKRTFVNTQDVYEKSGKYFITELTDENSRSVLDYQTKDGTILFADVMGESGVFDNPKNVSMIEYLISLCTNKNSIILDSFAGSGTTAHAVLNMNKADGGNRKFILIELNDYAESITAERVRRVITGYADTEGTGGDFSFYELGEPLLVNNLINENVDVANIRDYIWFTETHTKFSLENEKAPGENEYFLGQHNHAGYWFYYRKNEITTLDYSFLNTMKTKSDQYVIYADVSVLPDSFCREHNIIFKKIPRDIQRF